MPKDGTVHELTSNVGVTQTLLKRCAQASSSDSGDTATMGNPPGGPELLAFMSRPWWRRANLSGIQGLSGSQSPGMTPEISSCPCHCADPWYKTALLVGKGTCGKPLPAPTLVCVISPPGHPVPAAASGLPGDSRCHAGLPRYTISELDLPVPAVPSCLGTWS